MTTGSVKMAISLREAGKLEEAKSLILALLEREPTNASIWYQAAWIHDALGLEKEAVPYYTRALELGLSDAEKRGSMLGLGSTYRTLGMYTESQSRAGASYAGIPECRELQVFYAMVLYNLSEHQIAMEILLQQLIETSSDQGIQSYRKAIQFYSDKLDQRWD